MIIDFYKNLIIFELALNFKNTNKVQIIFQMNYGNFNVKIFYSDQYLLF